MSSSFSQPLHILPFLCTLAKGNPCTACVELETFDAQLPTDTKLSASDTKRRNILLKRINDRHDPLYHYLPVEITSGIFELYAQSTGYPASIYQTHSRRSATESQPVSPFRLTSVCSRWRSIGFSTPFLWSSIFIHLTPKRVGTFDPNILKQWLLRAGALPLQISILFELGHYRHNKRGDRLMFDMFDLIRSYTPQWQALNLTAPFRFSVLFLAGRVFDTPILTYIRLHGTETQYSRQNLHFRFKSPSLETVLLAHFFVPTYSLDWTNVTHVDIKGINADSFYWLLSHAGKLEIAVFSDMFLYEVRQIVTETDPSSNAPQVLPSLKRFELQHRVTSGFPPDLPEWFDPLNSFTMPSLTKFTYRFCPTWGGFDKTRFLTNVSCSQCTITHLTLDNIHPHYFEYEDLIEILTSLSGTLTHLRLYCNKDTPYAIGESVLQRICECAAMEHKVEEHGLERELELLNLSENRASFLPCLEEFTCSNPLYSNDIYKLLVGVLYTDRWKQISQIDRMIPSTNKVKVTSHLSALTIHLPHQSKIRGHFRRPLHTLNVILTTDDWTPRDLLIVPFNAFSMLQRARVQAGVELSIVERYYTCERVSRESDVMVSSSRFYGLE